MKLNKYMIPIAFFGILLISSFVPYIQIILIYWNGGILAISEEITGIDALDLAIPLNLIFVLLSVFTYFRSKRKALKILLAFFLTFFINGLTVFSSDKLFDNSTTNIYDWHFMVGAILTGALLFVTDVYRYKIKG